MASKKTVARSKYNERPKAAAVLKLSKRAKAEVAKLLARNQAGTITRKHLQAGLEEVEIRLKKMTHFVRALL
jgi:hypothetical protein